MPVVWLLEAAFYVRLLWKITKGITVTATE